MKKLCALCVGVVVFCSALLFLPNAKDRQIYEGTLRLHVLANSDEAADQERKLAVRDRILEELSPKMQDCSNRAEAKAVILKNEEVLLNACRQVLSETGCGDSVSLSLSEEYYPTRQYEDIALPAGKYLSLRIMIGQAKGQNWWCVLYPPVCLGTCKAEEEFKDAGFGKEQVTLVKEDKPIRYKVKFKILESVGKLFDAWFD